jgi:hypothetical protein
MLCDSHVDNGEKIAGLRGAVARDAGCVQRPAIDAGVAAAAIRSERYGV